MEPSQLGSLKVLNGTRNTGIILVRPLTVKVQAYDPVEWDCLCLNYQGAESLDLALDLMFLALKRRRVISLYTEVDAQWLIESRPAHKQCLVRSLTILALQYKLHTYGGLSQRALSRLWALGP